MIKVRATREGLLGGNTKSGYTVDNVVPFVALPSINALHRFVRVTNPATTQSTMAIVLDVGPWNVHDDPYVFHGARPQAESGTDSSGRKTNGAGIDLGGRVWQALGMVDNSDVEWEFIDGMMDSDHFYAILGEIKALQAQGAKIMSSLTDVQAGVAAIQGDVTALGAAVTAVLALIKTDDPALEAAAQALQAAHTSLEGSVSALNTAIGAPTPPPTPSTSS